MKGATEVVEYLKELLRGELAARDQYFLHSRMYQDWGFEKLYEGHDAEPENLSWVSQYSNANTIKTDFFEARSTAYAKSGALVDDL